MGFREIFLTMDTGKYGSESFYEEYITSLHPTDRLASSSTDSTVIHHSPIVNGRSHLTV